MRKYVGFAKDVGQISNTGGSNLIKYLLHRKVCTAEVDTSQEQTFFSHRGSISAFLPWLVSLNRAGLYNITDHLLLCIFLVRPTRMEKTGNIFRFNHKLGHIRFNSLFVFLA